MANTTAGRPTYTADYVKSDFEKAVFLDSPHTDNLMAALLSLGAEFWTMRRRMMVLEKFMEKGRVADPAAVEAYTPTAEEKIAWDKERDDFISRVFGVLTRETAHVGGPPPTALVPPLEA
jgi:hypothetical protein